MWYKELLHGSVTAAVRGHSVKFGDSPGQDDRLATLALSWTRISTAIPLLRLIEMA